jgi:hypothetical protein
VVIPQPSPRTYVSFAYDSESNQIILFGGNDKLFDNYALNNETWAYDVTANKWTLMKPSNAPPVMAAATMAYDPESDRIIMFGGAAPGVRFINDTWAYDYNTNTWTQMSNGPRDHLGGRMVYDAESDKMILFGGLIMGTFMCQDDTWAYDYNTDTWTDMEPSIHPPARNYQAIIYDVNSDRVLMWGGSPEEELPDKYSMWSYDFNTNTWQELGAWTESYPLDRLYSCMAYDTESEQAILFGGNSINNDSGTWAYDNATQTWLKMNPEVEPGPGKVSKHHMVYVPSIDRVILFGGDICVKLCELSNQMWSYDFNSNTWENIIPVP